jgi:hypothetical protein
MCILEPGPTFNRVPRERTHHPRARRLQYKVRTIETRSNTLTTSSRVTGPLIPDVRPRSRPGSRDARCSKTDWSDTEFNTTLLNQQKPSTGSSDGVAHHWAHLHAKRRTRAMYALSLDPRERGPVARLTRRGNAAALATTSRQVAARARRGSSRTLSLINRPAVIRQVVPCVPECLLQCHWHAEREP